MSFSKRAMLEEMVEDEIEEMILLEVLDANDKPTIDALRKQAKGEPLNGMELAAVMQLSADLEDARNEQAFEHAMARDD